MKLISCRLFVFIIIFYGTVHEIWAQSMENPVYSVVVNANEEDKERNTQDNLSLFVNDSLFFEVDTLNKKFLFYLMKLGDNKAFKKVKAKGKGYNIYFSEYYCLISTTGITKKYSYKSNLYKIDLLSAKVVKSKHRIRRYLGANVNKFFFLSEKKYLTINGHELNYVECISGKKDSFLPNPLEDLGVSETKQSELQLYNENIVYYCQKEPRYCYFVIDKQAENTDILNLYYGLYFFYKNYLIVYDENSSTFYAIHKKGKETIVQLNDLPELKDSISYYISNFRVVENQIIVTLNAVFPEFSEETEMLLKYSLNKLE